MANDGNVASFHVYESMATASTQVRPSKLQRPTSRGLKVIDDAYSYLFSADQARRALKVFHEIQTAYWYISFRNL